MMEVKDAFESRKSVREFDSTISIDDDELKKIIDLAKLSPSSYNLQPWEFVVVRDPDMKKKLKDASYGQKQVEDASAAIVVVANKSKHSAASKVVRGYVEEGMWSKEKADSYLEELKSEDAAMKDPLGLLWGYRSTGLISMSLMIAAESFGWQTGPMEGFDYAKVQEILEIPEGYNPMMMIVIGKAKESVRERYYRRPFEDIVHKDRF